MKKTKFTEQQIAFALRQAETGTRVVEVCRKLTQGRTGGRKRKMDDSKIAVAKRLLQDGIPPREVAKKSGRVYSNTVSMVFPVKAYETELT